MIVPDRHGTGTNGLLLTPPDAIAPASAPAAASATSGARARRRAVRASSRCPRWRSTSTRADDLRCSGLAAHAGGARATRNARQPAAHAAR